jgi:PAS domain S-box-containing protein
VTNEKHNWKEVDRLTALDRYGILDTPPEEAFDNLTALAAELLHAPITAVNLIAEARQWFKAEIGLGVREMPLDNSLCKFAILENGSMVVPDTRQDERFACNPLVTGTPGLRFYAGEPLVTPDGYPIGTLCVLDTEPRPEGLTPQQAFMLKTLAQQVMAQLELRRIVSEQQKLLIKHAQVEAELRAERDHSHQLNETLEAQVMARTRERDRIWELTRDLTVIVSGNGYYLRVNPAWTEEFGHSQAEVIGVHFNEFVHFGDRPAVEALYLGMVTGNPIAHFEARMRAHDGTYRMVDWIVVAMDGNYYASGRDVSQQRATEEQLRQAQKMEAIGQLTGGIAHDFNNLLQGITGSLEMLKRRVDSARYEGMERFISGAMNSAGRAAGLTHRLLAFARRQPLDPKPVKANPLIASIEDMLRRTLGEQIRLELVLAGGLWPTLCDPNQLENALLNLCINARDAMPNGGILIIETCNAHLDDVYTANIRGLTPGQYVCICVTDTGVGMSKSTIDRAFEPFFTTKPTGQGTGLGLSMIYGFTKQSEGHAKLYSEVGQGTTVKLYLPRYRGDALDESSLPSNEYSALIAGSETVLVVEDEPVVRALIVDVLHELGYRGLEAADGPSGLAILQSRAKVDLLITDIGLPGLNGRQLADAARLMRPEIKVLFMTGYAENAAFANGFLEHGMEMITKPFPMEKLASRVRAIIENA